MGTGLVRTGPANANNGDVKTNDVATIAAATEESGTTPPLTHEHTFATRPLPSAPPAETDDTPAGLPMPESVRLALAEAWVDPERVLLTVPTDVSLDGHPACEWIVACDDRILVVSEPKDGIAVVERSLSWTEVLEIRSVGGVGGGLLQAREGEDWVDLARYSNALARRLHRVARCSNEPAGPSAEAPSPARTATSMTARLPRSIHLDAGPADCDWRSRPIRVRAASTAVGSWNGCGPCLCHGRAARSPSRV